MSTSSSGAFQPHPASSETPHAPLSQPPEGVQASRQVLMALPCSPTCHHPRSLCANVLHTPALPGPPLLMLPQQWHLLCLTVLLWSRPSPRAPTDHILLPRLPSALHSRMWSVPLSHLAQFSVHREHLFTSDPHRTSLQKGSTFSV